MILLRMPVTSRLQIWLYTYFCLQIHLIMSFLYRMNRNLIIHAAPEPRIQIKNSFIYQILLQESLFQREILKITKF